MEAKNMTAKDVIKIVQENLACRDIALVEAVDYLKPTEVSDNVLLESEGSKLYYNADNIMRCYKEKRLDKLENRLLHILCHGLMGDFSKRDQFANKEIGDFVLDFRVDNLCRAIRDKKCADSNMDYRELYDIYTKRPAIFEKLKSNIESMREDDHDIWNMKHQLDQLDQGGEIGNLSEDIAQKWQAMAMNAMTNADSILGDMLRDNEQGNKNYGHTAGGGTQSVLGNAAAKGDYYTILKEIFHVGEGEHEDDASIDKIMYQFGFDNYGDIALVEPDEVNDKKKLHNIVIAMDTSGSCQGVVAEQFVAETRKVISELQKNVDFEGIYCIQADCSIQKESFYSNIDEFADDFSNEVDLMGWGGTSFIPVFNRCDKLVEQGTKIDALLYFTDTCGSFPSNVPAGGYKSILVIPNCEFTDPSSDLRHVPEWIDQKVFLTD